jgi:hypothetical protein
MWNARRLGPRAVGACTRDDPAASSRCGCGADLTRVAAAQLPAGGLVLQAHQHLAALTASPPGGRPAALTALREIYATAWRALRGLQAIPGQAPPIVRAVLDETRSRCPARPAPAPETMPAVRPSVPRWPASHSTTATLNMRSCSTGSYEPTARCSSTGDTRPASA